MAIECLDCRAAILDVGQAACPTCGSLNRAISITDTAHGVEQRIRAEGRHGEVGEVQPHIVVTDEVRWSHDRQQHERRRMEIDREHNRYAQTWYSLESGRITFHKDGDLDDPNVHGRSARRPDPPFP